MFSTAYVHHTHRTVKYKLQNILTIVRQTIAKTSIAIGSSMGQTSSIWQTSIAIGISWVSSSKSISESRISLTPLPLSRSSSSGNSSKMSSLGLSNLRGVNWSNWEHWVEGGGNKWLRVEGGSNSIIDWSNRQTGVSNTESSSISNVLNLLELSVGINIRVSTADSSVGVSDLLLDRVDVGITVVQVSELILSMELASGSVGSSSNNWGSGSISDSWGSSNNWSGSSISDSWSSSISVSWGSSISDSWKSGSLNSLNLNLGWSSNSIRITSIASIWQTSMGIATIAIGTSIAKTSIRIASIGQGGGEDLGLLGKTNGQKSGKDCLKV